MTIVVRDWLLPDHPNWRGEIRSIQDQVCARFGVTRNEMLSRRQNASVVLARHIAMRMARANTRASLPEIGRAFDRDHTTVLHALRKNIDDGYTAP